MSRPKGLGFLPLALLALAACRVAPEVYREVQVPSGLRYTDLVIPTGEPVQAGELVEIHYVGRLESGEVFDSSLERGQPIRFRLGDGEVPPGLELGVIGMRPLGRRNLIVPPELGFGDEGRPPTVPPGATLLFEVELLAVLSADA